MPPSYDFAAVRRSPVFWVGATAIALLWTALVSLAVWRMATSLAGSPSLDLEVYRQAGRDLLDGRDVYAEREALPFTYPPIAAVLAVPLTLAGLPGAVALMTVGSLVALALAVWVMARHWGHAWWWVALGVPVVAGLSPVWRAAELGQVNALLMALIAVDLWAVPTRWRGWLTGLAMAVKLTPGVFLLYLLATRQWRAAGAVVGGFAMATGLGLLVMPSASRFYWLHALRDPDRVGALDYVDNVSVVGALARVGVTGSVATLVGVVAGGAALLVARRAYQRGLDVEAVLAAAVAGLFMSPVTWSHHWIWATLIVLWCVRQGRWGLAIVTYVVTCSTPVELRGGGGWADGPVELASAAYLLVGVAFLVAVWRTPTRRTPLVPVADDEHGECCQCSDASGSTSTPSSVSSEETKERISSRMGRTASTP